MRVPVLLGVVFLVVSLVGLDVPAASAVEPDLVVEGFDGDVPWVESVAIADLVSAVPVISGAGSLSSVVAGSCSDSGRMTGLVFTGDVSDIGVDTSVVADALAWPSADVLRAGLGDLGLPGCWSEDEVVTATRRLNISDVIVDDGAGGDGDGFVECSETVAVGVTVSSVTETVADADIVVEVLGPEAVLVGAGSSRIGDLLPGEQATAASRFTVRVADSVSGSDWLTLVVRVGSAGTVYESHRHLPIGCGLSGSSSVSSQLVFPVAGANHYVREWLTTHNPAIHEGVDVFASRMVPVLAMADGVIADVNWEHDPYHDGQIECCAVALRHDSGWESWYLHLNNDTPGTDDGEGWGLLPGIEAGTTVEAGQVIGFVGDSTNAEETAPHTHLELHDPAGNPVDLYDYLQAAATVDPKCVGATAGECSPFVILSWNSRDERVWVLQSLLGQAGFSPGVADGIFGVRTDAATREFQSAAGLVADGLVDSETWEELNRVVDQGIDLLPDVVARLGARGPIVIEIQTLLAAAGYSPGPVDGIFGSLTEAAVRAFQTAEPLPADGRVDSATFAALGDRPDPPAVVRFGDRGPVVIEIQDRLAHAGYSPGPIDGIFGLNTERAVRSLQSAAGLRVDGIVGPSTFGVLDAGDGRVIIARLGNRGAAVIEVQNLLAAAGYPPGPIDGIFGSLTQAALRSFQAARGLSVDGIADEATLNAFS